MKNSPIVEMKQLVLSSALDAFDARTRERTETRWRETSLESGMQQPETRDGAALRSPAQHVHRCFDFGKLGHWNLEEVMGAIASVSLQSRQLKKTATT
jgi:hypothetical protein